MRGFLGLLTLAILPWLALAVDAPQPGQNHLFSDVYTVFQFPDNGSWIANVAGRPQGGLVVTRTDVPEVWAIDVEYHTGRCVAKIPNANSLIGITGIDDDVFVVIAGNIDLKTLAPEAGSFSAWKIDLTSEDEPTVNLITAIPEAKFLHGVATLQHNPYSTVILIADAAQNAIYRLDTKTAKYSIAQQDATFLAGVNNIRIQNGYVYYTATPNKVFARVKIDWENGSATGKYEVIANNTGIVPDGFALSHDGNTAYMATFTQNSVVKINLQDEEHQTTTIYGGLNSTDIPGSTTVWLKRDGLGDILYVPTNGGLTAPVNGKYIEPGKVVAIEL